MFLKKIIRKITPPIFIELYHFLIKNSKNNLMWTGNYNTWQEAKKKTSGYESSIIIEKVKTALLKVKNGEAIYERDSVLFDKIEYSFPLLSSLMWIASKSNEINVVDFGGSLGSTYFQNKFFLESTNSNFIWNVVEQVHFVDCGVKNFQSNKLKFYNNTSECYSTEKTNVLIFSGVLSYLENPKELVVSILTKYQFDYIIIDLTGTINNYGKNILTIQQIPPSIYEASYPCWFFDENYLTTIFTKNYNLIYDFNCELGSNIQLENQIKAKYKGYFFSKK